MTTKTQLQNKIQELEKELQQFKEQLNDYKEITCEMTDIKTKAQAIKDAVGTVYPNIVFWETDKPTVITALREVINQLQQSPGVISCADMLELCEEIEKL